MRKLILVLLFVPCLVLAKPMTAYGPTTSADQLWQIAVLARPNATVSLQQTMVAIYQANPTAFKTLNMYNLKPGVTLTIPPLSVIQQVSPNNAAALVSQQSQSWQTEHKSKPIKEISVHGKQLARVATKVTANQQQLRDLQNQYDNIGKALMGFDQQYQVRLADLEQHNLALQTQLNQLQQQMVQLQQQTVKQQADNGTWLAPYVNYLRDKLGDTGFKLVVAGIIIILLLLIWWLCPCRRRSCKCDCQQPAELNTNDDDHDTDSEYDFLGSEEGIPAKLDLARAYIDMGDKAAAKEILTEIRQKGSMEQQEEAQAMLEEL